MMFRVFNCLTAEHDLRLVLLAGVLCLLISLAAVSLFHRARAIDGRTRATWLVLAAAAAGCGIWAMHFIAMLAYEPVPVAYDMFLTSLSLAVAVGTTFAALAVASMAHRLAPLAGGAIFGAAVACMHFTGMSALQVPGVVAWISPLVIASILVGAAFGALAMTVAVQRKTMGGALTAAALLTLAIMSHHFTAMGAAVIIPNAGWSLAAGSIEDTTLAIAIAAVTTIVLAVSLVGTVADTFLTRRTRQFDMARQALIEKSEQELKRQNLRLDAALNNMSQGLCMFDASQRVVVLNRRFLELYRLSPEVVRPGCTLRELIEHRKQVGLLDGDAEDHYRSIVADVSNELTKHWIIQTKDGRVIEAQNELMPDGGWVTTHEDVTARRSAELQLRTQKLQFDAALNNMIQGLLMFDAESRMILFNQRFLQLYNLPANALTPGETTLLDLVHLVAPCRKEPPQDAEAYARSIAVSAANGKPVRTTTELRDGRVIAIENHPTAGGGWVVTHEDVTARHIIEAQLRDQKLQLDAALDNMAQGLCKFDSDGKLALVNHRYLEIYGLPPGSIRPGMTIEEMLEARRAAGTFDGDTAKYVAYLRANLARGETMATIYTLPDGRTISLANRPMEGGRWVSTHEDVTERQRAAEQLREQKLQLDSALNNMSQGLNMFDAAGRLVVWNKRYLDMYRLSPDDVKPGISVQDLVRARVAAGTFFAVDPDKYSDDMRTAMNQRSAINSIMNMTDGRVISVYTQPMADGNGWVVTHEDITNQRRIEEERDRNRALASTVIENVPAMITLKDARDFRYLLINRSGEESLGIPRERIIGKTAEEVFTSDLAALISDYDQRVLATGERSVSEEHPIKLAGGDIRIVSTSRAPIRDQNGEIRYLLSVVDDRTQRRRVEAQIAYMEHHDSLTGLPNRTAFNECLTATIEAAAEESSSFALLSLDCDRFKEINDVFGHTLGDKLLCELAQRIQQTAEGAFVARLGGDEFTVIAADGSQPAAAESLADRIATAIGDEFTIDGNKLRTSFSIGIAVYPVDGHDTPTLVANADAALYRAKGEGRGCYRFFEAEMDKRLRDRRVLQQELQMAIPRGELVLHYQPQARITGEIVGLEALVRWHHPFRGIVSPGSFISMAEESGLIVSMGEWILRQACHEAASWPKPLQIGINLSPVQFRHGDLPALVHSVLLETGLPPSRLELEITEGVLIGDFSRAVSILRRLKALGVRIAMDDFGTGYSSLSYLQSFPFDKIKIDQAFMSNLEHSVQSATIIRAVIGLARGLGVPVTAEGVETREQLAFLTRESCDQIQGYLIGRPLPIDGYAEVVGRRHGKLRVIASAS